MREMIQKSCNQTVRTGRDYKLGIGCIFRQSAVRRPEGKISLMNEE
jgi:hypothetical protein